MSDHVHCPCQLHSTSSVSELAKEIKRSSSIWIKEKGGRLKKFAWQAGYGAFSIGQSQIEEVKHYITNQAAHHQHISFQDEYREFPRRYEAAFDERYVWA